MKTSARKRRLKKILLADPDADSREVLRWYLQLLNYPAPIEARDGEEALSKALFELPDLILMEVSLPRVDGFQIVAHLRNNPWTRNMLAAATTAMALPGDRERCLARGFDAYLAKPFTLLELDDLLQAALLTRFKSARTARP
jgi:CheY-like chemotaxis protein